MGSNAAQRTKFLPAANTNVLIDRLDDVDESGDFVMNLILRESVLAGWVWGSANGVRRWPATGALRSASEHIVRWRYEGREERALSTAAIESRSPTGQWLPFHGFFHVQRFSTHAQTEGMHRNNVRKGCVWWVQMLRCCVLPCGT